LLAAEMLARTGRDPGEIYQKLTEQFGAPVYERIDAPATPEQKTRLAALSPEQVTATRICPAIPSRPSSTVRRRMVRRWADSRCYPPRMVRRASFRH